MTITTRSEDPAADEPFFRRLILESLTLELGAVQWPEAMREPLLEIQYKGRRRTARQMYPEGDSRIILVDGAPAGWVFTAELEDAIWLAEILVLPELRGRGVGSAVLRDVIAAAADRPVRLNVSRFNSGAMRLYERMGFRRVGGDEAQHVMEYRR
jgi:GNAT superfamily N-acetyltransferase